MKKTYEAPQFFIVQMATQQMLALSQGGEYSQGQPTLAPGYSRKNNPNGYDEDEEDEEEW